MAIEKNRKIQIRLSEEELETLNEYVKEKNTTKSDVVRDHIKNLKTDKDK
jgi:ribosomal protein S13